MKTPSHWNKVNFTSLILYPLGLIYGLVSALRIAFTKPCKTSAHVICIGNLTAGGSGKTPTAVAIAQILQQQGHLVCFLTRGYGGKLQKTLVSSQHTAAEVGDEPLILARQAPVVVDRNRVEGAQIAILNHADTLIMDDGFQNPYLYKDISLLVIDGEYGLGNCFCIPSGPLREFITLGRKRIQAVILLGNDTHNVLRFFPEIPVFKGRITPLKPAITNPQVIAFAGIGRPEKFYNSLRQCGLNPIKTYDFPDHHFYTETELQKLISEAQKLSADLYTTAKDIVKIPQSLRPKFKVLEIGVEWDNAAALASFLQHD